MLCLCFVQRQIWGETASPKCSSPKLEGAGQGSVFTPVLLIMASIHACILRLLSESGVTATWDFYLASSYHAAVLALSLGGWCYVSQNLYFHVWNRWGLRSPVKTACSCCMHTFADINRHYMSIQPSNPETGFFSADNVEKPLFCQLQTQVVTAKKNWDHGFQMSRPFVFLPF